MGSILNMFLVALVFAQAVKALNPKAEVARARDAPQIKHPTASLIAKVATAQDDVVGDGTTSTVLLIGELLKQADVFVSEGLHPRIIAEGFEAAKEKALALLEELKD